MKRGTWILGAVAIAGVLTSLWLYSENRALKRQLDGADAVADGRLEPQAKVTAEVAGDGAKAKSRAGGAVRSFLRLGRDRTPPQLEPKKKENWAQRRQRRQGAITAMLGRGEDETAEQYKERMVPLITAGLARPRNYVDETRRAAEEAAGVTPEQSAAIDEVFDDAYAEAIELTNGAVAAGDLTPYERNVSGVLDFVGGLGAVYSSTETRYNEQLSPEQRDAMRGAGFDLGEYLGVSAPWERLDAPPLPPPPGDDS